MRSNVQLSRICDVIGITSEFAYGTGDFINALTTPYGATTFSMGRRSFEPADDAGKAEEPQ